VSNLFIVVQLFIVVVESGKESEGWHQVGVQKIELSFLNYLCILKRWKLWYCSCFLFHSLQHAKFLESYENLPSCADIYVVGENVSMACLWTENKIIENRKHFLEEIEAQNFWLILTCPCAYTKHMAKHF